MRLSFDVGVALIIVLASVCEQLLQHSVAINSPAKKTSDGSFSVWFRAEPGLPRKKDMKVDKLNRLIGADYNEMWMSKTAIVITVRSMVMLFSIYLHVKPEEWFEYYILSLKVPISYIPYTVVPDFISVDIVDVSESKASVWLYSRGIYIIS